MFSRKTVVALFLTWLIPGSGHCYYGYRSKGFLLFILIISTYFVGMAMMDFQQVTFFDHPYYFCCRIFVGAPTIIAVIYAENSGAFLFPEMKELGLLYIGVAALLNVLLLLNIYSISMTSDNCPHGFND